MAAFLAGALWASLVAWLLWRILGQFAIHRDGELDPAGGRFGVPDAPVDVSIVIPARNEARNITDCLSSFSAQAGLGPGSSITVVDDGSQDGTTEIVREMSRRDPRIGLVAAGPLPPGWLGKSHACWRGALTTTAEFLCFVDADVRAAPDLVRAAIGTAERHRIDMLSLHPFQQLGSFWERLIIPAGLVLIGCVKDLRQIDDPGSPEASANGQFILIRRTVYLAVGGHRAVRTEVSEDTALAIRVKQGGWCYRMMFGEQLASTRMYTDFASLWEGLTKNTAEILGDAETIAIAVVATAVAWSALVLPLLTGLTASRDGGAASAAGFVLALLGSLTIAGVQVGTARHFRIPPAFGLLFPLAYSVLAILGWRSVRLRRDGRITWKGRSYRLGRRA